MKKSGTHIALHRETVKRLDDANLNLALGGNLTSKPPFPSNPASCTCTLFCTA